MNTLYLQLRNPRISRQTRQKGMATLLVSVMLVLLITVGVFATSRSVFSEVKATQNTYWTKRATQAGDGGIEYAIAWLVGANSNPHWTSATGNPPYDLSGTPLAYSDGAYTVNVKLSRQSSSGLIELVSTATGTDRASATIRQQIVLINLLAPGFTNTPLVINGCLSGVTGNPSVGMNASGVSIATSTDGTCISPGHLGFAGTTHSGAFTSSAWNAVFGVSPSDLKAFAGTSANAILQSQGGGVFFYDSSNPAPINFHASVGTAAQPGILVFGPGSGCPAMNGNPTIYGIVYYDPSCTGQDQGWGGATIFGTVAADGDITQFTANGQLNGAAYGNADFKIPMFAARILGSWRDF